MKLHDVRQEYDSGTGALLAGSENWADVFRQWYADANGSAEPMPNAMVLSTVASGTQAGAECPRARVVLLKEFDGTGFSFFTNTGSAKSLELATNPNACLLFYWKALHRQVQICGRCEPVPEPEAAAYFASRPEESRYSSWVSRQSQPIPGRQHLLDELGRLHASGLPEGPPHDWGGYRLLPESIEFWQGAEHRLHHRVRFSCRFGAARAEILSP
jgi:pyridoxamine 5'-phosphate oxidase